jgi:hypothetical protein
MGHADFHGGVGADWLVTPVEWFTALLDKLEASRDVVWVTDTVSWHQYVKGDARARNQDPRDHSGCDSRRAHHELDPALYDLPSRSRPPSPPTGKIAIRKVPQRPPHPSATAPSSIPPTPAAA